MDLDRLRSILAAPFASLFLILLLCTLAMQRPMASVGFRIPVVRIRHDPNQFTCDGRFEFVRRTEDRKTWINQDEIPENQTSSNIVELMENRAERVVYVEAESDIPYGDFVSMIDQITGAEPDIHVVVVSGEVRRRFDVSHAEFRRQFDRGQFPLKDPITVCDFY